MLRNFFDYGIQCELWCLKLARQASVLWISRGSISPKYWHFANLISMLHFQIPPDIQLDTRINDSTEQNRTSSLAIKCGITCRDRRGLQCDWTRCPEIEIAILMGLWFFQAVVLSLKFIFPALITFGEFFFLFQYNRAKAN